MRGVLLRFDRLSVRSFDSRSRPMKRIMTMILIGAACGLSCSCVGLQGLLGLAESRVPQVIDRLSGGSQQVVQGDPVDVALADAMSNVIPPAKPEQGGGL